MTLSDQMDPRSDLCPRHPDWTLLSERERELWRLGYKWGYRDAEVDAAPPPD